MVSRSIYHGLISSFRFKLILLFTGTHPEFVYLQTELSRREAKRKEFAARQRTLEIAAVSKKRKLDEEFIWGCWKVRTNTS